MTTRFGAYAGRLLSLALVLAAALWSANAAHAVGDAGEKRVALVIGIGGYKDVPALKNPVPDAQAISAMFRSLGYDVVEGYDTDLIATRKLLQEFRQKMDGTKAAVFYFAGHGISIKGENYILPADARLQSESDIDFNAISVQFVINQMEQESKANVVLLDACRDNPFEQKLKRSLGTRSVSVGTGFAPIENRLAQGRLISFATMPGNVAYDGEANSNSPFTSALLKHMAQPGVPVSVVMDRVRKDVWESTGEKQRPYLENSLIGEFFLNPARPAQVAALTSDTPGAQGAPAQVTPAPPTSSQPQRSLEGAEVTFWESVQKANSAEEYKAYLATYPSGVFAALAKSRLERLTSEDKAKPLRIIGDTSAAGTQTTERALKLKAADIREIHDRLRLIDFDPGASGTKLGPKAREAITNWQKSRNFPDTGFLTKAHHNALLEATDDQYERWKNTAALQPTRTTAPAAARPVRQTIRSEQQRRAARASDDEGSGEDTARQAVRGGPAPRQQQQRRPPADNGAGAALGAAIIGGVIGGAIGGGLRRGW